MLAVAADFAASAWLTRADGGGSPFGGGGGMGVLLTGTAVLGSLEGVEHDGPLVSNNRKGSEESLGKGFARGGPISDSCRGPNKP